MELKVNVGDDENIKIDPVRFQKMLFVYNALEEGWTIKKRNDTYIFTKKHENRYEVFQEDYLEKFVSSNFGSGGFI
jgi:transposase